MNLLRRSVTGPRSLKRGQKLSPAETDAESRAKEMGDVEANRGLYGSIKSAIEAINASTNATVASDAIARPSSKLLGPAQQQAGFRVAVKVLMPLTEELGDGGAMARNGPSSDFMIS